MLNYVPRLDGKMDQVMVTLADHGRGLTALEIALGHLATTEASHYANTALRLDPISERLDRVERRMDLREA